MPREWGKPLSSYCAKRNEHYDDTFEFYIPAKMMVATKRSGMALFALKLAFVASVIFGVLYINGAFSALEGVKLW